MSYKNNTIYKIDTKTLSPNSTEHSHERKISIFQNIIRRLYWQLIYLGLKRDVTLSTYNGLLSFSSKDWLIGKYLYLNRGYEVDEIHRLMELLRIEGYLKGNKPGVVLDVGANIGMISIALLKHGYFQRAIAFEPTPDSYRLLKKNLKQNGLSDRVTTFPCALSSMQGELSLELSVNNSGDNRIRISKTPGEFSEEKRLSIKVPTRTLDQIQANDPTLFKNDISLIWIDIQGHEGHFFLGARNSLKTGIPVVTEFWPYAIYRSGISRHEYCRIISDSFTHALLYTDKKFVKYSVYEMDELFDMFKDKRAMCLLVLVPF